MSWLLAVPDEWLQVCCNKLAPAGMPRLASDCPRLQALALCNLRGHRQWSRLFGQAAFLEQLTARSCWLLRSFSACGPHDLLSIALLQGCLTSCFML